MWQYHVNSYVHTYVDTRPTLFSFSSLCFKSETEVEIGETPSAGAQTSLAMDNPWPATTEEREKSEM